MIIADVAYMALLSMYMVRSLRVQVLVISSRLAVYIADRIRDNGEPWGVPLEISKSSEVCSLPLSMAFLADKKDLTQVHMPGGKPLSQKIYTVRAGFTLSKKPEISKRRRAPTHFAAQVACIQCTKVAAASTAKWCGLDPN